MAGATMADAGMAPRGTRGENVSIHLIGTDIAGGWRSRCRWDPVAGHTQQVNVTSAESMRQSFPPPSLPISSPAFLRSMSRFPPTHLPGWMYPSKSAWVRRSVRTVLRLLIN